MGATESYLKKTALNLFKAFQKEIKLIDAKIEASKAAYKNGDKQTAYDLLKTRGQITDHDTQA